MSRVVKIKPLITDQQIADSNREVAGVDVRDAPIALVLPVERSAPDVRPSKKAPYFGHAEEMKAIPVKTLKLSKPRETAGFSKFFPVPVALFLIGFSADSLTVVQMVSLMPVLILSAFWLAGAAEGRLGLLKAVTFAHIALVAMGSGQEISLLFKVDLVPVYLLASLLTSVAVALISADLFRLPEAECDQSTVAETA